MVTRVKQPEQLKLKGPSSTLDNRALFPKRDRGQVQPHGHKRLFKVRRIRCTTCSTSPETKVTTHAGKRHAWCLQLYITPKAALQKKQFLAVRNGCTSVELELARVTNTAGAAGSRKRQTKERPTVPLYFHELPG